MKKMKTKLAFPSPKDDDVSVYYSQCSLNKGLSNTSPNGLQNINYYTSNFQNTRLGFKQNRVTRSFQIRPHLQIV